MEPEAGAIRPLECLSGGLKLVQGQYWLLLGITLLGLIIGGAVPFAVLLGPMLVGIFLCYLDRLRGEETIFDRLFKGFDVFLPALGVTWMHIAVLLVAMVVCMVPMVGVMFGLFGTRPTDGGGGAAMPDMIWVVFLLWYVAFMLVGGFFYVAMMFSLLLLAEGEEQVGTAFSLGLRAVIRNFFGVMGLVVLLSLLSLLGAVLCYVGLIFLLPIMVGAVVIAYRQAFPIQPTP